MASLLNYGFPFYSPPPPTHSQILPPPYHPNLQPPSHPTIPPPPYHPNLQPPPPGRPLLPPPPPTRVPPPLPHHLPPPHHLTSPPPSIPPPPPHHLTPPPPSIPPPPSPGHHTIIIVVFVSLGGLFLLGCLSVALCCFLKKRKKKIKDETDFVRVDEHVKIQEVVVPGPHGTQTVVLNIEEDIHVEEKIMKNNEIVHKGSHYDDGVTSQSQQPKALQIAKATASDTMQHYDQYQKS